MTRFDSSSSITSSRSGRRSTSTEPSGSKVSALMPPYAAMYWSCLPIGSLQDVDLELARLARELLGRDELALERVQAVEQRDREAARRAEPGVRRHVGQAVELEAALGIPAMPSAALKMRCSIWSTESTISVSEYARRMLFWKRRATQTKTYLSTAAATRKPPCSRE